ncbi:response regulator [Hyalangium versicolor]|uniref:response regulator n=1 Tax=Hyalangium versicolor TaxID=2861190 RepID=UPI001CCEF541|nr:response regulator [Hyalangium versicolor]
MMRTRTLLFLEDDEDLQSLVTTYLRDSGYQVQSARDAEEARAILARTQVDAAIVDGQLPGMTGAGYIEEVRQTRPDLPILFASAFWRDLKSHELLTKQLRVARILHKPYTPQELLVWVEQVLSPKAKKTPEPVEADDIAAAIAALSAEYGTRLPEKYQELAAAVQQAQRGGREELEEALKLAHKLHGTAGSYGFVQVSAAAGQVEKRLRQRRDEGGGWDGVSLALQDVQVASAVHAHPNETAPHTALGTVLVVDDDPSWLAAVERMGHERLVRVLTARTAEEAAAVANQHWLDGVLLHVHLGKPQGGFEVAAQLRGMSGAEALPLTFFSADGALEHRVSAAHAGASLYLSRPFTALDFMGAVERMVAARRPERARVLALDDDPLALRALTRTLASEHIEVLSLSDPYRLLEALTEHRPDLLLMDVEMPGLSGLDLCRIVRSTPAWQELPILLNTGLIQDEFRIAAFRAGADDYLSKPVLREELLARVQARLERGRLARERAERDALTGLMLRRPFLEHVHARLAEAQRWRRSLALCLLDVDHFKKINDTYGHLAGDRVLMTLGRLLLTRFRKEDVRGRWGGEEFMLALMGESAQHAREILARTAAELAQHTFEGDKGERFQVTFSAGVAVTPNDGLQLDELVRRADERLYRAKTRGRNRIEID